MTESKGVIALAQKQPDAPGDIAEYDWQQLEPDADGDIPLHYNHVNESGTLKYGWDVRTRRGVWREIPNE